MLQEVELGTNALNYIRSCLAQGNTLAAQLSGLPLEDGRIITFLPTGVELEPDRDFEVGGVVPRSESEPHLATLISAYLQGSGRRYVVFEDAVSLPSDPVLASSGARIFTYDSEVYHFLTSESSDMESIIQTVRRATFHLFIGVLTALPQGSDIRVNESVPLSTLNMLVQNTSAIVVGAYDGEGELIWMRRQNEA